MLERLIADGAAGLATAEAKAVCTRLDALRFMERQVPHMHAAASQHTWRCALSAAAASYACRKANARSPPLEVVAAKKVL